MGGKKKEKKNTKEFLAFFLPNLGSEAGNLEDRGRWKGASGTSEQAASLLASRSYQEGRERERKGRRGEGGGRVGRRGWSEGTRKAVCKLEKRERERETQPHESSEITSRTQAGSRKSESASARPLRSLGPDSPQTCPNHPPNTVSSSLLRPPPKSPPSSPPPPFQKPKQHKGGWQ